MSYEDLLKKQEQEISNFSDGKIYWIFVSNETEFLNKLKEHDLSPSDVISIGAGGYIRKEYKEDFIKIIKAQADERKDYTLTHIYEVVLYYCWDYEIYISVSYSLRDMLTDIMDLTNDEIEANKSEIKRAYNDYRKEFERLNL